MITYPKLIRISLNNGLIRILYFRRSTDVSIYPFEIVLTPDHFDKLYSITQCRIGFKGVFTPLSCDTAITDSTYIEPSSSVITAKDALTLFKAGFELTGGSINSSELTRYLNIDGDWLVTLPLISSPSNLTVRGGPLTTIVVKFINDDENSEPKASSVMNAMNIHLAERGQRQIDKVTFKLLIREMHGIEIYGNKIRMFFP